MRSLTQHHRPILFCSMLLLVGNARCADALFDPTQPYGAHDVQRVNSVSTVKALQLEAILHSPQRRLAIVNGQLVHEGDRVGNNLIEIITPTSVHYSTNGQQHELKLASASVPDNQLSIRLVALTQPVKDKQP